LRFLRWLINDQKYFGLGDVALFINGNNQFDDREKARRIIRAWRLCKLVKWVPNRPMRHKWDFHYERFS
jgi:hypothetical protein